MRAFTGLVTEIDPKRRVRMDPASATLLRLHPMPSSIARPTGPLHSQPYLSAAFPWGRIAWTQHN